MNKGEEHEKDIDGSADGTPLDGYNRDGGRFTGRKMEDDRR
jgi:hypothetical protein